MKQSYGDLLNHLSDHIYFLKTSAEKYDEGNTQEAKRLAVHVRTLVHDTPQSNSLLNQLNKKNIQFYDTALNKTSPQNIMPEMLLLKIRLGTETQPLKFLPHLDDLAPYQKNRKKSFKNWWNKPILQDMDKNPFSRKDIVLRLANQDGGAHVDPILNEKFANLTRKVGLGWSWGPDEQSARTVFGAERATMRQIAYEVLKSLEDTFPEFFKGGS
jgi:hypothetical protein